MTQMTAAGYEGSGSPDRVDALVWAMTELFPAMIVPKVREIPVEPMGEGSWMG
jgi:phage terminase large subunit-like protein